MSAGKQHDLARASSFIFYNFLMSLRSFFSLSSCFIIFYSVKIVEKSGKFLCRLRIIEKFGAHAERILNVKAQEKSIDQKVNRHMRSVRSVVVNFLTAKLLKSYTSPKWGWKSLNCPNKKPFQQFIDRCSETWATPAQALMFHMVTNIP